MLDWLAENWGNIVIIAALSLAIGATLLFRVRAHRKGRGGCGGCAGCAMKDICHEKYKKNT
jgi:hypothetical protein